MIRSSSSYLEIIDLSNLWLPIVWKKSQALGVAPSGSKASYESPKIKLTKNIAKDCVGSYHSYETCSGPLIKISPPLTMYKCKAPLFVSLRDTILHETQHAIDERYNVWSANHNHWFNKRLNKLIKIFPIESL